MQPFYAAAISVDSFYAISGLLLAYGFYEKQKRHPSKSLTIDVLKGIAYRFLRIAPCFLIVR
jgi:peptidoglycan/LPS O-acetylase OafA/YrhL